MNRIEIPIEIRIIKLRKNVEMSRNVSHFSIIHNTEYVERKLEREKEKEEIKNFHAGLPL